MIRPLACLSLALMAGACTASGTGEITGSGGSNNSGTGGNVVATGGAGGTSGSNGAQSGSSGAGQGQGGAPRPDSSPGSGGSGTSQDPSSIFGTTPTPPSASARFPFPQNRLASGCSYPSLARNADIQPAYDHWKTLVLTSNGAGGELRVQRTSEASFDTVSEGIGYGMLISVYMNDQTTFDKLWRYEQKWLDPVGLMNWQINAAGTAVLGKGSATDGDEDMAWALIMADKQWGGSGTLGNSYLNLAKSILATMWQYDVDHGRGEMLKPGDGWMEDKTNPSYFAPAYYRVFASVTGDSNWMKVVDSSYSIIAQSLNNTNGNATNGLVPDWCTSNGSPQGTYGYDACRTPFRIALDACLFGEARATSYLAKTSQFFAGIGAASIKDGYSLTGSPTSNNVNIPFMSTATVGAMSQSTNASFLNDGYARTAALARNEALYYNSSWGVLSLLAMTGNFLNYTQYP